MTKAFHCSRFECLMFFHSISEREIAFMLEILCSFLDLAVVLFTVHWRSEVD